MNIVSAKFVSETVDSWVFVLEDGTSGGGVYPPQNGPHMRALERFLDGEGVIRPYQGPSLDEIKKEALAEIDKRAEERRLLLASKGEGQLAVYLEKVKEAEAYQEDPDPDPDNYPFLSAELGVTPHPVTGDAADDLAGMAAIIIDTAKIWRKYGASIEKVRRTAKYTVETATDTVTINKVLVGLEWPKTLD